MRSSRPRYITTYYDTLRSITDQGATQEGAVRFAFQSLLSEAAKTRGFAVLGEQTIQLTNRRAIRLDGEVKDQYKLRVGVWEAKDTADNLDLEIRKKIAAGYPTKNIIFENTQRGVLYQNGNKELEVDLTQPEQLLVLLNRFLDYTAPLIEEFHRAVAAFRTEIPELARGLTAIIEGEKRSNKRFVKALETFLEVCQQALNPDTSLADVEDMLKQHLLTERIFRSVFNNPDFVSRNAIAREIETVIAALTSRSFSRAAFTSRLDHIYRPIEVAASTIGDYSEKQSFLNTVYEQFFQSYSTDTADTHGIVYTPAPIVKWMVSSVEQVLQKEFGLSLSDAGVHILDPATGTGTFILEIIDRIGSSMLEHKYKHELHCNEILLLPYYIAAQNIEHEYFERTGGYEEFPGICFTDTLDLAESPQLGLFSEENTERIQRQKDAPITVIIGNPPYNLGQQSENNNNKNRSYKVVDKRIRETYGKDSKATLNTKLYDSYVKFFRWACDRLEGRNGIVCLVTNNSFVEDFPFDGMRKHLQESFNQIYHLDLHGNVRKNTKLSGTTHNVFGIQVGVGITVAVINNRIKDSNIYYARVPENWTRTSKLDFLVDKWSINTIDWQILKPDNKYNWITEGLEESFYSFIQIGSKETKAGNTINSRAIFKTYSLRVATNRDEWMYDFNEENLEKKVLRFIKNYNYEVFRWFQVQLKPSNVDDFVNNENSFLKWTDRLKEELQKQRTLQFYSEKIRQSTYRPFCKQFLYFDHLLNQRRYQQHHIFPSKQSELENKIIVVTGHSQVPFSCQIMNFIPSLDVGGRPSQCFPFYVYDEDGSNRRENITDWALGQYQAQYGAAVTKWDIFHYVYALLHHPHYRERYRENLKRELPRIPFVQAAAFPAFVAAGAALAALHVGYEDAQEYRLRHIENRAVPFTWRVERMSLSKDKTALRVNEALTLDGVPPEAFLYRLGNRSALEWVLDQYQVATDKRSGIVSDPNNDDDPQYIVRLLKKVVTVSVETVRLVAGLPEMVDAAASTM